jgi:hydroxymethylpyrimidine/phosphomethylpyrimidine kinase
MAKSPPIVLAFAASDPTGGAGAQADLLTLAARGCHPISVVTALTVQDTRGVERMQPVESSLVADQARALLADFDVAAFKLGVLGSAGNATAIAEILAAHRGAPVVVDPVLASGRGDALAGEDAIAVMREKIFALTTVATPNSIEAQRLGGVGAMLAAGCRHVLVTGTHEDGADVVNRLYDSRGLVREDRWPRLPGSYHGSGCTLASALAAALAKGLAVPEAARDAQDYTWHALAAGFRPGAGQHLPQRFFEQ